MGSVVIKFSVSEGGKAHSMAGLGPGCICGVLHLIVGNHFLLLIGDCLLVCPFIHGVISMDAAECLLLVVLSVVVQIVVMGDVECVDLGGIS